MADEQQLSVPELVQELVRGSRELIREEVQLARAEVTESVQQAKRALIWLILAIVPGIMALVVVPLTLVYAFDAFMPRWVAALIVSVALIAAAAVLALVGAKKVKETEAVPRQTIETVREDVEWLRDRLS